jgi:hypothetical protein
MPFSSFSTLPDTSRIWIFSSDRELSAAESEMLLAEMGAFLQNWTAHKVETHASTQLLYNRFLIIGADEDVAKPGGCSIDEMTRRVRVLGETYGVEFIGTPRVDYRDQDGSIMSTSRSEFQKLAESKNVGPETIVFDNTITTLSELTEQWEIPASRSWHARAFDLLETA